MKMASMGVDSAMLINGTPKKQDSRCAKIAMKIGGQLVLVLATAITTVFVAGAMAPRYMDPIADRVFSQVPGMARDLLTIVNRMDSTYGPNGQEPPSGIAEVMMGAMYARPFLNQASSMTVPRDPSGQTSAEILGMMDIAAIGSMSDSDLHDLALTCLNWINQYRTNWSWTEFAADNTFQAYEGGEWREKSVLGDLDGVQNSINDILETVEPICEEVRDLFAPS